MILPFADVLVPLILFVLMSPGVLLQLPAEIPFSSDDWFGTRRTRRLDVLVHGLIFFLIVGIFGASIPLLAIEIADTATATILFMLLSPGFIVQAPPFKFFNNLTDLSSVAVHAVVFALALGVFTQFAIPGANDMIADEQLFR